MELDDKTTYSIPTTWLSKALVTTDVSWLWDVNKAKRLIWTDEATSKHIGAFHVERLVAGQKINYLLFLYCNAGPMQVWTSGLASA